MNSYEAKQAARRTRLEQRADNAAQASNAAYDASRRATAGIEMGQPILVGHHSERRHRAALERSDNAMRRSCQEHEKAKHYAARAAAVGTGGVSSDDPDAVKKLREQLAELEALQERMKGVNAALRKTTPEKQTAALIALGFNEATAAQVIEVGGYPKYRLTNNGANIRRIAQRIAQLEATRARESVKIEGSGYRYQEDTEENRVIFEFDGKPCDRVRDLLRGNAFKWSPSRMAWVRKITPAAIYAGRQLRAALEALELPR